MAKEQSKPEKNLAKAEKPAQRKAGRPERAERPIGSAELAEISDMFLRGKTHAEIASRLVVSEATVRHHLDNTLKPLWQKKVCDPLREELARINVLERVAWQEFESQASNEMSEQIKTRLLEEGIEMDVVERVIKTISRPDQMSWLGVIQWCVEQRRKLAGYYAPTKGQHDGQIRATDITAAPTVEEMFKQISKLIEARNKYEAALEAAQGSVN